MPHSMSADENFSLLAWKTTISDMLAMPDIEWGMGVQVEENDWQYLLGWGYGEFFVIEVFI